MICLRSLHSIFESLREFPKFREFFLDKFHLFVNVLKEMPKATYHKRQQISSSFYAFRRAFNADGVYLETLKGIMPVVLHWQFFVCWQNK